MNIPEDNADPLIQRIRLFIVENKMTIYAFSDLAGMPYSSVSKLFKANPNIYLSNLRRMEKPIPKDFHPELLDGYVDC